ncbi:MAG: hypothetical protein JNG86_21245, partial [Verrucomicrobiaceae bacterium]|nr:hypothetical protein [Verrucomicrobiaceae bacterium]
MNILLFKHRIGGLAVLLASLACVGARAEEAREDLPLPRWTEEELRAFSDSGKAGAMLEPLLPEVPGY